MWNLITGKSSEKSKAPSSESRRRKDNNQRSAPQPAESIVSSKSARKPSRGDERGDDRGFNPTSTSYSSTSRSAFPGTASASIASSYATASNGQTDDAVLPPGLVRNASLADRIPNSRPCRDDREHDRARERKSERRRSASRDREHGRGSKRRERKAERDRMDKADDMDRGLNRSGTAYAEDQNTSRAGGFSAQANGSFNAQVGSSGFTQFPGQYDGSMAGFTRGPPPLHDSMSAHVQDQFPGQFPLESAAPYRPPLAASESGPGLAAEYYGDAGQSVAEQPGVRPHPQEPIIGAEPHLQFPAHTAAPHPVSSSAGGIGAAASFYSGVDFPSTLSSQTPLSGKPPKQGKANKPSSSGSFSGSAALAGSAVLGSTAGITGQASYNQGSGGNSSAYYQQGSGRPPSSAEVTAEHSSNSAAINSGYHAASAPVLPTLGAAAAGAAAGYLMSSHSSAQQQPSMISGHSGYSSSAMQRPQQSADLAMANSATSRPPRPAKYSSQSSTLPLYTSGQSNPMVQKHRHRKGPLGTFVEFWTDPDGVAQYEEYTEYIGICKDCFVPGSSPRDAPRKHHYRRRRSDDRYGSSGRVDKESRWGSSDGENRRRKGKSWLAGGITGYGLAEVGKTLFSQKRRTNDTYNVHFSRGNASVTSLRRQSGSYSPIHGSQTSYGVVGGSAASISRRRSRSRERVETGITSDGKVYKKDPHGSFLGGPVMKTYTPRHRPRSRSRSMSADRYNEFAAAALGAAVGSSVVAAKSRHRSRSPEKAFVRSKHRSKERSRGRGEGSTLGGFFTSPSEKRQRSHRKKKKGFFSFGNSSSSSADADLAFGAGLDVSRTRKQRSPRSRNDQSTDAAFLGLSAAAAAIALRESQKKSKYPRKADLVAVKESKSKKSLSSERHHMGRRTSASLTTEEDLWESASEEDDSSSVDTALAYGGPARRSQESLNSDSSGTGKWGWRWGSKKRSKRTQQVDPTASLQIDAGAAAATLAGATAGFAGSSNMWQNDARMGSSSNLPPLQQVYPVPTSDPSRFDVTRHDSIASLNQPHMTSRPAPVPLQQPQPIFPVSHTVYATQPPYIHSYSAPRGPPAFSQFPYQSHPSIVGDTQDQSYGLRKTNIPGSFPGDDVVADNTSRDGRVEFSRRRRETSPITRSAESIENSLPRRRRASTRNESSAVRNDFPEEPKFEESYDLRRRKDAFDQGREEAKVKDSNRQRQSDHERRLSDGVSLRRAEFTSEPEGNINRKGESSGHEIDTGSMKIKPVSRVVPVATRSVGASISARAPDEGHFGAETHQEEHPKDGRKSRIENGEDPATDEPKYFRQRDPGTSDNVKQHGQIARRILSKSVKNPNHENYADYFTPKKLLSKSNDDRRSTNVNGDNDVTSYQTPQIITVEPKGSGLSSLPAHGHTDKVDLDHINVPWQVPRLNVIEPTPPHSIAGSNKGDASPVINPEDASLDETEEILESSTTPKVTWGKDEMHTYEVVTPQEHLEDFVGTSRNLPTEESDTRSSSEGSPLDATPIIIERMPSKKPSNEEEDTHSLSEGSPLDATPIIVERVPSRKLSTEEEDIYSPSQARPSIVTPIVVERVPRHIPGEFCDDLEFTATVAAGLEDTGFDPAIVIDDATFRRRDSPPGSKPTGSYRRPFAETVTDLGLDSPGTEGAPPQRGFVEGELPPTPKYEHGPSANGNSSASKLGRKNRKSRQSPAQCETEDDEPAALSSTSQLHDQGGVFDGPARYSIEPQPVISVPVSVVDHMDEGASAEVSKYKQPQRDAGDLESTSSSSPLPTDLSKSEYFDVPEAAAEISKPSRSSRTPDDMTVDLPSTEQPAGDFQDQQRTDKRKKKSKKSEQEGKKSGLALNSPGSPTLERKGESSSNRKSDRKSSRRDSERYDLTTRGSRLELSGPVSEEYGEEKSKSRKSADTSELYDSPPEDTRPTPVFAPIEDEFDEPRTSKNKSKRSSRDDDMFTSLSSPATFETKREPKSKSKMKKKGGLLSLFGASKSSDMLSETTQDQGAMAEATSDISEEPRRKSKKSKERPPTRDGDHDANEASDKLLDGVPESALAGEVYAEGSAEDSEDADGKRKRKKDRKTSRARNIDDGHSPAYHTTTNLSQVVGEENGGKSRRKEHKRRSQERDLVEESGRVTQALQAKVYKAASPGRFLTFMLDQLLMSPEDRDLPSTRNAPNAVSDVIHANAGSGSEDPSSFLGERPNTPPPPEMFIPTSPHSLHAEKSVETLSKSIAQPESKIGQIAGTDAAPFTPPMPASPVPELEDHRRRTSVVQVSENPQSPSMNSSPTAIPLHFRRPPASPGPARSSPFASPASPSQNALVSVPPQRKSRPNSTEFKSSTEFRPLWLVERHGPRQDQTPLESYPSLPSSHTTSRSSSVHDPDEMDSQWCHDDGSNRGLDESDGEDLGLRIDVSNSFEQEDLLSSRQATPTAASFHLDTKDNVLAEAMQDNGKAGLSAGHEDSGKEATRGGFSSSPMGLSHNLGDDLLERFVLPPIDSEAPGALPPLPASGSTSPLLEDRVQEMLVIQEGGEKLDQLPFLPPSSFSPRLHKSHGQDTQSVLKALEELEKLPPLPASRSSSPTHKCEQREAQTILNEAEPVVKVSSPSVTRSPSPSYEGQERVLLSASKEAGELEQLPPLPGSRSSSPWSDDQTRELSTASEKAIQLEQLTPLPSSKSSSPSRDNRTQDTFSIPMVGAILGLAAATVGLGSAKHNQRVVNDRFAELEASPLSVVDSTAMLSNDETQKSSSAGIADGSEMLPTKKSRKKDRKGQRASNSSYGDDFPSEDEAVAQSVNDQNTGNLVTEGIRDIQEEDGQDGAETWLTSTTSKRSKKERKGKKKGRGAESAKESIEPLASFKVEATSHEGSRVVSPIEDLPLTDGPPPLEGDIGTSSQTREAVQDDVQGLVTNSKKSKGKKGKKGKKKLARSWQEETIDPGEIGSDTALERSRDNLEPQEAASAHRKENSKNSTLSDVDLGCADVVGQPTNADGPALGSDAVESNPLAVVNQEDGKTKEHLVMEDKRIPETSPNLQQRLEFARQEPQSRSNKLDSVRGFEESTNAVTTPWENPEEEFFTPMGVPQSTQEREAEAEFPFPTGRGKASKKAKKKRKTLTFDDYIGASNPVLRPEASPATGGLSKEFKAEETGGFGGATSTTPPDIVKPAIETQGDIVRSSHGKVSLKTILPTFRGSSSFALAPETARLRIEDDIDQIEPAPANPTDPVLGPESVPLPVDEDFDLVEESHVSSAGRSLTPEMVPLPGDSDLDLTDAPQASLADQFLTRQAEQSLTDDAVGLPEASRASSAGDLLSPEAVPLPTDGDLDLIEAPLAAEQTLASEVVPMSRDKDLDLTETPQTSPAKPLLAPETVPLPTDEDLDLTEAPKASPAGRMLTPEDIPLPRDRDLDLTETPQTSPANPLLAPETVPLPIDQDLDLTEAPQMSPAGRMSSPEDVPLPRDRDLDLTEIPQTSPANPLLAPETVPLPIDQDLDLTEASQTSPAGRMLTPEDIPLSTDEVLPGIEAPGVDTGGPEAVPLPTDEDLELIDAIFTTEGRRSPDIIPLPRGNDLDLIEAPSATSEEQALIPGAFPLPRDEDPSLITPQAISADKWSTPEAIPLPATEDLDLINVSPASINDQSLDPEAVPLHTDEDLSLIAPQPGSVDKQLTPESIPLPAAEDFDLIAPRGGSRDEQLAPEAIPLPMAEDMDLVPLPTGLIEATPLPADEDLSLISPRVGSIENWSTPEASPGTSAGQSLTLQAVSLPTDRDLDLVVAPLASSVDTSLNPEARPLPTDKDSYVIKAPPESSAERTLGPQAVPLPTDDDLDLLEALPASPILQSSDVTMQESGSASEYGLKLTAEKTPALTLSPLTSGDGRDQSVICRALGNKALVNDDPSDGVTPTQPGSGLGDVKQDPSAPLARSAEDVSLLHPSSSSSNVGAGYDPSSIQEAPEAFFVVVPKKKSKKGKRGDHSLSVIPDVGPASVESDSPFVAIEPDPGSVDRAVRVEAPKDLMDEGEWDIPSKKKKKSKKGKNEKSAVQEPGYASPEVVPIPIKGVQVSDDDKDLTTSAELGESLSLQDFEGKEASASWEPFQKKPKKGKRSKTLKQQSLSRDSAPAVGEILDSPVISESSLAPTAGSQAVREILADRGETPDLEALSQQTGAVNPSSSDPKPERTNLESPSNYEDPFIKDLPNEERSMGRMTEVSSPMMSVPDNLLATKGKVAFTSTAREVQEMLADRGSPRPSDDSSPGDIFPSTTESLTKPPQEDDDTWDIPVKKRGKKGKKDRPLQGHEYSTDESLIPPTPAVEPETAPSNEDAVVGAADNFTLKKSKKDKKGKKKTLRQASTRLQDEAEAEVGVMPETEKDLGRENRHEESYFDQPVRPAEFQELPMSPRTHNEELLEYAASVPLPSDEVNDKPAEIVVVQRVEESEEAWSRAVEIDESEIAPADSSRSQQLSKSPPDVQSITGRSTEVLVLRTPNTMAYETASMTENTMDSAVEDDYTTFHIKKLSKKAKGQQKKQLERGVDDPEDVRLPTPIQPEPPAIEEGFGSSFPVAKIALESRFSPEMGAASRDALRELELEDGVSYFGLTLTETGKDDKAQDGYSSRVHGGGEDHGAVHDNHAVNDDLGQGFLTAHHEGALATIVEQPDTVDPLALGHEPDSELADQGLPNWENPLQLFESTSKDTERNIVAMEPEAGPLSFEQSDPIRSYIDDSLVQEPMPDLATTDISTVHHSDNLLSVENPASRLAAKSVARESVASPSSEDFSTFTTSKKSKKGKKSKRKQEVIDWENETASPAAVYAREPTVEIDEASLSPAKFETSELRTSRKDIEYLPTEQPEYQPRIEASLPPPKNYSALGDLPTLGEAEINWATSTKKSKKQGKKPKQQADVTQSIAFQPQLDKAGEWDALTNQENQFQGAQRMSDELNIRREPQESQHTDMQMLVQHADPALMAKHDEHTSSSAKLYHQVELASQDGLAGGVPQTSTSNADIDEVTKGRQSAHEHATADFGHPQEVTATNEEKPDELWDIPTTKKSQKSKKSKKQSTRMDSDTDAQGMRPEPIMDQLQQYRSTISNDLPQYIETPEESRPASPPQVPGHHGDGQLAGIATLATIGAAKADSLWHNNSAERGDFPSTQREDRHWKAHHNERVEPPNPHDKADQLSESSLQLDNAIQQRVSAQSQLYDESQSALTQPPAEDGHRRDIARPPVPSFHHEDDLKRDSAVQISDSPLISERLSTYDVVRDSGYQGTEPSPTFGTDPEFIDTSGVEHHPETVERLSAQARHEEIESTGQVRSSKDSAFSNVDNPLNISIEVDPAYEAANPRYHSRRGRGRVRSNSQEDSFDYGVSSEIDLRRTKGVGFPPQHSAGSPQPSPVESTSKGRSSILFQSSPSTRDERIQPQQYGTPHGSHDYVDRTELSPAYNDSRGTIVEPEMTSRMVTHDGASTLAARASSLAALSGVTAADQGSPRSLFGGPVGINSDLPSIVSPPRTPFSLENSGRRQLNTITEFSPEESSHHKKARAISDIRSPERGTKSARRSMTPGEISLRRMRSPKITGTRDKSLTSTDDVLERLSWPPVDEDKHSVDLERSRSRNTDRRPSSRPSNVSALMSDAIRQRETEHRSLSGASVRSGESINAIIRTPEQFRSASGLSNRSGTPPLRRADTRSISGDLRAASKLGEARNLAKPVESEAEPAPAPAFALPLPLATPSSSTYDPVKDKGKSRVRDMADVYEGWGDVHNNGSPLSPTRPPSMRRRQSMQLIDLESRVDQLVSENRLLQDAKSRAERGLEDAQHDHVQKSNAYELAIGTRDAYRRQKDSELDELRQMLQNLQNEVTRLAEVNQSLETTREVDGEYAQRYSHLQAEHSDIHAQWQQSQRELEDLRSKHSQLSTGMEGIVRHEVSIALEGKNAELAKLRGELEETKEQVRALQRQILASKPSDNFLIDRDEDYFDTQCQQLCQRVQQWVLRFSKLSDTKACRLMGDIDDEKVLDRLDNAILDGSDVDDFLADRVKRRDVFMSMVMTMIWEYVFTRYLFGMDREQRQKLKALEKTLADVGPMSAVQKWRATTLTLLSKREAFVTQRSQDAEAVVQEIYSTLSMFLPPAAHLETQNQESLRHVMKAAIDLSIEMRTQRAEYVMLPPLQPEYNTNGDLARKVYFNASMMNERSGDTSSNEELEAQSAVVRMVLFPLVVKKDDASGDGEQIVVCPAQVLVAKPGKEKKVVRVLSGDRMDVDRNRSVQSFAPSSMDMGMGNMI